MFPFALAILMAILFVAARLEYPGRPLFTRENASLYLPFLLFLPFWAFFPHLLAFFQWRGNRALQGPMALTITDEGLAVRSQHSTVTHSWSAFVKYRETPNLFLLHSSSQVAVIVPKRALGDDADVQQFRQHLAASVH